MKILELFFASIVFTSVTAFAQSEPSPQLGQTTSPQPTATPSQVLPVVNASPAPTAPSPVAPPAKKEKHFTAGLLFMGEGKAKFDNVAITTGGKTYAAQVEFTGASTYGISIEYNSSFDAGWSYIFGLEYESARDIKTATLHYNSKDVTVNYSNPSKFNDLLVEYVAVYRWSEWYLPFGFNLSNPGISGASGDTASGAIGAQVGIGYRANENVSIELQNHVTGMQVNEIGTSYTATYGSGYLSDLRIIGRYSF